MASIDLNADLGEGFGAWQLGDDDAMLEIVTSANVACGFHAGDPAGLLRVCRSAAERGVRIGAQVGYHDLSGFGRRFIDVDPRTCLPKSCIRSARCRPSPKPAAQRCPTSNPMAPCTTRSSPTASRRPPWRLRCGWSTRRCRYWV
ncbi:lamB/YcsF family protein [Mycobacterium kansasii]|uniref:LamB/YcsF family protein n=1 Tax=Mycobacterium kansasii TaxID=1768 RepID=A0A1V3XAJ2_MYCKA|nr:lamB/YcsF family protein [Mycobacterium kansasii]